ncbi:TlpA family protein disulfide reductase [Flagellimonas meishanensis]|uniref:TlpA family protein disulfide reductase n=1 Tax=Flagellimonas meishanensis TaxID=2873264 RepID=UPI001CA661ED|nr:TlpA disulfide reductase family protein [[Muricauda] meishanensis]
MRDFSGFVLLSLLFLFGCNSKTADKKESDITEQSTHLEAPILLNDGTSKFPVYDFTSFEPLLNREDDKTYIINFWATWCKPCIEEMPHFERINAEQQENNVEVILVSLDMPSMWKTRLEPYVESKGIQSRVVILDDPKQNDWIPKISEEWGGGIPATLIYNKNKKSFYERSFTYDELNAELQKFIN